MGKKNRKKEKAPLQESNDLVNNPFGALDGTGLPDFDKEPEPQTPQKDPRPTLRVRIEKKGRGGKTVTVIQGFEEYPGLDAEIKSIRKSLGTGGTFYEDTLELQGDQRQKAAALLRERRYSVKGA